MSNKPTTTQSETLDSGPNPAQSGTNPGGQDGINVAHLQRLARLALEPAQAKAAETDLHNIVAMIDAMQAVPTDNVEPLTHPLETSARLRPDQVSEQVEREVFQQLAPAADAGFYLVPKVIE